MIFNNDHWPPGSFTEFSADRFHVLLGAVDIAQFRPKPSAPKSTQRWIVGSLANKNPGPLIDALDHVGPEVSIRLYGIDAMGLAERYADLVEEGRLQLMGPLFGEDLARFYHGVDCVVATEMMAGWANLAAEAMASGVPVICTRHGTIAFAHHEKTALVVDYPLPANLAASIRRLQADPALSANLCGRGREIIERYSWDAYTERLLSIIHHDGRKHYFYAHDLGLFGKWPVDQRARGLDLLLAQARGASVIEFGMAEGAISRKFLEHGASLHHGFELDADRVTAAEALCAAWSQHDFRQADLSNWDQFRSDQVGLLQESYDIVLYLGLQHHLPTPQRLSTLKGAISLAKRFFAFRAPAVVYESDGVGALLRDEGFIQVSQDSPADHAKHLGLCSIYERVYGA